MTTDTKEWLGSALKAAIIARFGSVNAYATLFPEVDRGNLVRRYLNGGQRMPFLMLMEHLGRLHLNPETFLRQMPPDEFMRMVSGIQGMDPEVFRRLVEAGLVPPPEL